MKFAVISDTHFGDSNCVLVKQDDPPDGPWELNEEFYQKFLNCLDKTSPSEYYYLIILGDVFDLAVSNYANTFNASRPFFERLGKDKDNVFKEIIIVTGNHDHALWSNLQYTKNIAEKIKDPGRMEWAIPGILDNRNGKLQLKGKYYQKTFLNDLCDSGLKFNVMSPNIYLLDKEKTILFTHGQFFEGPWALFGEIAQTMFGKDLDKIRLTELQHILGDNFALNQLMCSGLGQAEINFTTIIQDLEHDFKNKKYSKVLEYIWNLIAEGSKNDILILLWVVTSFCLLSRIFSGDNISFIEALKHELEIRKSKDQKDLAIAKSHKAIEDFTAHLTVHLEEMKIKKEDFITKYHNASLEELKGFSPTIDKINFLIFGHTHQPVSWSGKIIDWDKFNRKTVPNTGAWLFKGKHKKNLCGANVFTYDSVTLKITQKSI